MMGVDDDWDEYLSVHYYTPTETLRELAHYCYLEGTEHIGHVLGLQIYDAAFHQLINDKQAGPYVEALERAIAGLSPRWT